MTQQRQVLEKIELAIRRAAARYPQFIEPQPLSTGPILFEESLEHLLLHSLADEIHKIIDEEPLP